MRTIVDNKTQICLDIIMLFIFTFEFVTVNIGVVIVTNKSESIIKILEVVNMSTKKFKRTNVVRTLFTIGRMHAKFKEEKNMKELNTINMSLTIVNGK